MSKFVIFLLIVFVGSVLAREREKKAKNCDGYEHDSPKEDRKKILGDVLERCHKEFKEKHIIVLKYTTIKGRKAQCCELKSDNGHETTNCILELTTTGHSCECKTST